MAEPLQARLPRPPSRAAAPVPALSLPSKMSEPGPRLENSRILIHGPSKFGKSTLCSQFPDALFLWTERGLDGLSVYRFPEDRPVQTWQEFLTGCRLMKEGDHPFKTLIIDTLDNMYDLCRRHILGKHKVEHESEIGRGYGKGSGLINDEFKRVLFELSRLPYGVIYIAHTKANEIETTTGKITRHSPNLPTAPREICLNAADIILFCDFERVIGEDGKASIQRVLRTRSSAYYDAGDRFNRLPNPVPLGAGAKDAYEIMRAALVGNKEDSK